MSGTQQPPTTGDSARREPAGRRGVDEPVTPAANNTTARGHQAAHLTQPDSSCEREARDGVGNQESGGTAPPDNSNDAEPGAALEGPSDAELLQRLRSGDQSAYGTLYQRHAAAAMRLARRYARQKTDADDIVSASFADILQAIRRGSGPTDSFRYYLLACVRRNGGRNVGQRWTMPLDEATAADQPALAVGEGDDLDRLLAWRAFENLPSRYRTALWHSLVEGDSLAQVGEYLGLNANAAGALVHRAKEQLRQSFLTTLLAAPGEPGACDVPAADLAALARGTMRGRKAALLSEHVLDCGHCRARLVEIEPVEQAMKVLIGPAVLGLSVTSYLGRRGAGAWWAAGTGAVLVAAVLITLLVARPPAPSGDPGATAMDAAAGVTAGLTGTGAAVPSQVGGGGGLGGAQLDPTQPDAVAPATPVASPVATTAAISQPSTPHLYPGDSGVLRLSVDAGGGGEVRVRLPDGLSLRAAALSPTCREDAGVVACGPLSGQASVAIPFTLDAAAPMGAEVTGGQAWVERDGQQVAGPIALDVAVHADPCCTTQ